MNFKEAYEIVGKAAKADSSVHIGCEVIWHVPYKAVERDPNPGITFSIYANDGAYAREDTLELAVQMFLEKSDPEKKTSTLIEEVDEIIQVTPVTVIESLDDLTPADIQYALGEAAIEVPIAEVGTVVEGLPLAPTITFEDSDFDRAKADLAFTSMYGPGIEEQGLAIPPGIEYEPGWDSIDSAPKDGTEIRLHTTEGLYGRVKWSNLWGWHFISEGRTIVVRGQPTCWKLEEYCLGAA